MQYVYLLDLDTGNIYIPDIEENKICLSLEAGEMGVLLAVSQKLLADKKKEYRVVKTIADIFSFRRTKRFVIGEKCFYLENLREESVEIQCGDWSVVAGKDFSGSGIYETVFTLEDTNRNYCIDLGKVYCTCEVFLNGVSLGTKVMNSYRYEIPSHLLKDENHLELLVTNTPANEYIHTKSFDKWKAWQLTPYWQQQKLFMQKALQGGLYGPVQLLEEV